MGRNLAQSPLQIRSSSISPATKRHSPHSPLPLRQGFKATVESPTSVLQNHWSVDLEAAAAAAAANCTAAHRVTGAYDPSQDSAVAAQCSRIRAAFPSHGLLLALSLVVTQAGQDGLRTGPEPWWQSASLRSRSCCSVEMRCTRRTALET